MSTFFAATASSQPESAPQPESDALEALERADHDRALALLMRSYGEAVYRYCRQLIGDEALAEEVHQMTFVQAYESLPRFARRSTLKTWLFGIARHRALDALKIRRRRRRRFHQVETLPEPPDPRGDAGDALLGDALRQLLRHCLDELAPKVRSAVLLRFQEGLSYVEMARASSERAPTLQARVSRALPVLRRCLDQKGAAL